MIKIKQLFIMIIIVGLFLPYFSFAIIVEEDNYSEYCVLCQKPSPPENVEYSIGSIDGNPIVMIDWDASENKNLEENDLDYSDVSYKIDKSTNNANFVSVVYDASKIDNLNIGGFLIDEGVEWNKTYTYRVYAYDTINDIESDPASVTFDVVPVQEEKCNIDLALQAELEELDASTKIVRLNWNKYCDENVEYRLFRDNEQILTIKPEEVQNYAGDSENMINYIDKTIPQTDQEKEYEYKVEVWGYQEESSKNIFIEKAFAAPSLIKKAESKVKIKLNSNNTTSTPTDTKQGIPEPIKPLSVPTPQTWEVINFILKVIVGVGMILFIIMLFIGGVMFITSSGDETKAEKAKKLILWAVIGVILLLSAWGIATYILKYYK